MLVVLSRGTRLRRKVNMVLKEGAIEQTSVNQPCEFFRQTSLSEASFWFCLLR